MLVGNLLLVAGDLCCDNLHHMIGFSVRVKASAPLLSAHCTLPILAVHVTHAVCAAGERHGLPQDEGAVRELGRLR